MAITNLQRIKEDDLNRPGQVLGINQFKMFRILWHIYKSHRISEKGGGGSNI